LCVWYLPDKIELGVTQPSVAINIDEAYIIILSSLDFGIFLKDDWTFLLSYWFEGCFFSFPVFTCGLEFVRKYYFFTYSI
jgi:hypothetical protein